LYTNLIIPLLKGKVLLWTRFV